VRVTWEGGDARRFARQAAEAGFGVVIAGGGDGTVSEVVDGLVDGRGADSLPSLDGEPIVDTRFQFEVLPRRLPMKLPAACPLLVP
jgi:diacylglycerol kinase family enzyme